MKHWPAFFAITLSLIALRAQPSGQFSHTFTNVPIQDFSGTISTNVNGVAEEITLALSPQGRITGEYSSDYDDGVAMLEMSGALKGTLAVTRTGGRLVLNGRGPISGTVQGIPITGTVAFRAGARVDVATGGIVGNEVVTVCIRGRPCRSVRQSLSFPLPDAGSGESDWTLALDVTSAGNVIAGTATVTLANGRSVNFLVKGAYSPRRGTSRLNLRGIDSALGTRLTLTMDSQMQVQSLRGRLFGHQLVFP